MTQSNEFRSLVAAAALSAYTRVTVNSSGEAALATNTNQCVGVNQEDVAAAGIANIRLYGHGTVMVMADGAITAGGMVFPAANGKVSGSTAANQIGLAAEAATADRDIIEVVITHNS